MRRVLIVEDDADISELLTLMVVDAGGEPLRAFAGDEAVAAVAAAGEVAVAIVDLSVPRLKGAALVAALAAQVTHVVVVSAARDAELVASAHNVRACFTKPFDVQALRRCLTELLSGDQSQRDLPPRTA